MTLGLAALGGRVVEHLAQVGQEGLVLAQRFAGRVRQLGHRLAVAVDQLHDDVERLEADVVGQVRADAETGHDAVGEVAVQLERLFQIQSVREHQPLGLGVDAQRGVVGQRLFSPHHRVARIVAQPID